MIFYFIFILKNLYYYNLLLFLFCLSRYGNQVNILNFKVFYFNYYMDHYKTNTYIYY